MDDEILVKMMAFKTDPLGFVLWVFDWDAAELEGRRGPEPWQVDFLTALGAGTLTPDEAIRLATVSGNGVGKSALVSWIILWSMTTCVDTKGVVTANTETQLKTKTWPELGKWYNLFIGKDLFKLTATALFSKDPEHERTWRTDMVPWSEHNIVAFQGLHNEGKRLFIIFDEAAVIPKGIWEAGDGCMTDRGTQRIWCVFGNPNAAQGRFRDCFPGGQFAHRWTHFRVDSRSVSFTDKDELNQWIKDYGEDNDFVRVRVLGIFPRTGSIQFIGDELVNEAARRDVDVHLHDAFVIGVDVARFGDNASVIYFRKGRDGRSIAPIVLRGVDTMTLAGRVSEVYSEFHADAVFVDGGGVGGGVVDRLRQLQVPVWDIQFGGEADSPVMGEDVRYANKRCEMWGHMRSWLKIGAIPDDADLREELSAPSYGFNKRDEIQLESKEEMRKRKVASPDRADALALTFAYPVMANAMAGREGPRPPAILSDYNPLELAAEETV